MKLLTILTIIFTFNTIQAGLIYEYFEEGTKRVNNFTGTVEWYREKEKNIKLWDYKNHTMPSYKINAIRDVISQFNLLCKYAAVDIGMCQQTFNAKLEKKQYVWDKEVCGCIKIEEPNSRYFAVDGCKLDNIESLSNTELITSILKAEINMDSYKVKGLIKKNDITKHTSECRREERNELIEKYNIYLNLIDPIIEYIPIIETIYPKGWTTEKKYLK